MSPPKLSLHRQCVYMIVKLNVLCKSAASLGGIVMIAKRIARVCLTSLAVLSFFVLPNLSNAGVDTGLVGDDRVTSALPIGFPFRFYGETFTEFYLSTNGLLQFAGPTTQYANSCLPPASSGLARTIHVFWDDLRTDAFGLPNGKIQYETVGTAPNRQLIAQWTNQYFFGSNLPMGTFQAILFEGSNEIALQYRFLRQTESRGSSATIGIQGPVGATAYQLGCNQGDTVAPEQSVRYTPNADGVTYTVNSAAVYNFLDISGLTPSPPQVLRYTSAAPTWLWDDIPDLNLYQIEIQSDTGVVIRTETLAKTGTFTWSSGFVGGQSYRARVRGSTNSGGTWELWSGLSPLVTIDLVPPLAEMLSAAQVGTGAASFRYRGTDDLSGIQNFQLQIANDSLFANVLTEQTVLDSASTEFTYLSGTPDATTLYARIRAVDRAGNTSSYSPQTSVTLIPPPTAGLAASPLSGEAPLTVQFQNTSTGAATGYLWTFGDGQTSSTVSPAHVYSNAGTFSTTLVASGVGGSTNASATVTVTPDVTPPVISAFTVDGVASASPITLAQPRQIGFTITDASGVQSVVARFGTDAVPVVNWAPNQYRVSLDALAYPNGSFTLTVTALDSAANSATTSIVVLVDVPPPSAPRLISPTSNATTRQPTLLVSGRTELGLEGQISVNGVAQTGWLTASANVFSATVPLAEGSNVISAVARNSRGVSPVSSTVNILLDTVVPVITNIRWNGADFGGARTITDSGKLSFSTVDASPIASISVKLGSSDLSFVAAAPGTYDVPIDFATVANGPQFITIVAADSVGNTATSTFNFTLNIAPPATAPSITSPTNNATVNSAAVGVSGRASLGTQVQLYLNGNAIGGLLSVDAGGNYYGQVTLGAEGNYTIAADARNIRGTTPRSADTNITFMIPGPSVSLVTPGNGATLTSDSVIEVAATAQGGRSITGVTISIDGASAQTFAAPPYRFNWNVNTVANGSHTITATATDSAGRSGTVNIAITLAKPPPPVITPYIGRVDSVSPATSYGTQPIIITGRSLGRGTNQTVANASLKLLLTNNGFERRIGVVTDANSAFSFAFVPQATDSGVYQVALIHPEENITPAVQANFAVNRLTIDTPRLTVQLARGFPLAIRVNASTPAGLSSSGVSVSASAAAQPGGALPTAVVVTPGAMVNVANGGTTPLDFTVNTGPGTPTTGTLILQVFANESGSTVRNEIRIDFTVSEPTSRLLPNPTYVQTGVKRGQSVSAAIAIENKGLIAANNVTLSLTNLDGSAAPTWIYLASAPLLGNIAAGSSSTVQISAAPTASVLDGIYDAKINVFENGSAIGSVAISIAVTSADTGVMVFKAADIYTNTLDLNNNRIPGVANVSIRLQNDAVATQLFDLTTNGLGEAVSASIPSGRYRYRATAASHSDTSGMVTVRPGTNTSQNIFLDYQVVSFEWSVNETTIQDRYDVTITATFQAQVPAPVVILEPSAINLPDMQVGEEFTGELTISNYGLVRADNVRFTAPTGNEYFRIDVQGTVPTALDAKSRVVLPYRVTQIKAFPGLVIATGASDAATGLKRLVLNTGATGAPVPALRKVDIRAAAARGSTAQSTANGAPPKLPTGVEMLKSLSERSKASSCYSGCEVGEVEFEFTCANGDTSKGKAGTSFCKTYGSCAGGTSNPYGTGPGSDAGGWGGGSGGSAPIPLSPKCTPDCQAGTCCNPPGGGDGSGGKGGTGGLSSG